MTTSVQSSSETLLLRIPEAARTLAVSRGTIYNMIASGDLQTVTVGKAGTRLARATIEAWLEKQIAARNVTKS